MEKTISTTTAALEIEENLPNILKNKNTILLRRAHAFSQINEFESAKLDLDLIQVVIGHVTPIANARDPP